MPCQKKKCCAARSVVKTLLNPKIYKILILKLIHRRHDVLIIQRRIIRHRYLEARLVDTDNPKLAKAEADAVIIVNTYMYISNRVAYMQRLRQGLTKGGLVLIVDYKEKTIPVGPPVSAKVPLALVEKELKQAGFKVTMLDDTSLDYQYIVTAVNE